MRGLLLASGHCPLAAYTSIWAAILVRLSAYLSTGWLTDGHFTPPFITAVMHDDGHSAQNAGRCQIVYANAGTFLAQYAASCDVNAMSPDSKMR